MTVPFSAFVQDGYSGKRMGRFEILCKLGEGGMSEVFLGWQKAVGSFQRPIVLKRILETVKRNEEFQRMFVKEAKITSALNHGGIAHLYELAHDGGELFMVMEFVPGATLVEITRACRAVDESTPIGFTLSVLRDTAQALHYAHTFIDPTGRPRPVIHRDVAEKNIMVALDGSMKLLDFGIARHVGAPGGTQVGQVKGTVGYMSPEQVCGEPLDARTDVFSLGVVLHECLTGQRLFRRASLPQEVQALLGGLIPPPSAKNAEVSSAIDAVVMKALQRDKNLRYATAREMAEAIEAAGGDVLWENDRRAEFIQRHFASRQQEIKALLGDPSATDLSELAHDEPAPAAAPEALEAPDQGRPERGRKRSLESRKHGATPTPEEEAPRPAPKVEVTRIVDSRDAQPSDTAHKAPPLDGAEPRAADAEPRTVSGPPPIDASSAEAERRSGAHDKLRRRPDSAPTKQPAPARVREAVSDDMQPTEEEPQRAELAPQRFRAKNLAAEKEEKRALRMQIIVGVGVVITVALAAFLIFG